MDKLGMIETLAKKILCPVCSNSRFLVLSDVGLPRSICDYHVVCNHCHYKFIVTRDVDIMQEVWSQIGKDIIRQGCPECGDHKLHFELLCYVDSEDLHYLIRCVDNNHYSRINQAGIQYLF